MKHQENFDITIKLWNLQEHLEYKKLLELKKALKAIELTKKLQIINKYFKTWKRALKLAKSLRKAFKI